MPNPTTPRPQHILLFKLGAIGDVCMMLPAVQQLHRDQPGVHITWICGTQVRPLIETTRLADRLITIDEKAFYGRSGPFAFVRALFKLWWNLIASPRPFDRAHIAYLDPRYSLLLAPGLIATALAHAIRLRNPVRAIRTLKTIGGLRPGRYHTLEYYRLFTEQQRLTSAPAAAKTEAQPAAQIDQDLPPLSPELFPPLSPQVAARLAALPKSGKRILLAPGGAANIVREEALRRWPIEHYVELARLLTAEGHTVVLTGAPSDAWVTPHFAQLPKPPLSLVGETGLLDFIALCRDHADLVVTHDSGPLHLALLSGTPTLALFGPTRPDEKVPRSQLGDGGDNDLATGRTIWGGADLACRPCYDGKKYADCATQACMREIAPRQVWERIRRLNLLPEKKGDHLLV